MTNVQVTVETVTPAKAKEWLGGNTHNRNLKVGAVQKYARDMLSGRWDLNGESIKFNGDGRLLDGQNRLHAVIESGATVQTLVVRGLPAESQQTVDVGVPRKLADVLKLRGEMSAIDLAGGINRLYQFERNPEDSSLNEGPTIHGALALIEKSPGLRVSVREAEKLRKSIGLRSSVGVALHYVLTSLDAEDAEFFFARLNDGAELETDSPIYLLREMLLDARVKSSMRVQRRTRAHDWALCVKAWNAYREGRKVKMLVWRPGGARPENFPVPA